MPVAVSGVIGNDRRVDVGLISKNALDVHGVNDVSERLLEHEDELPSFLDHVDDQFFGSLVGGRSSA